MRHEGVHYKPTNLANFTPPCTRVEGQTWLSLLCELSLLLYCNVALKFGKFSLFAGVRWPIATRTPRFLIWR